MIPDQEDDVHMAESSEFTLIISGCYMPGIPVSPSAMFGSPCGAPEILTVAREMGQLDERKNYLSPPTGTGDCQVTKMEEEIKQALGLGSVELVIGERMSRPLAPRVSRPRLRESLGEGGGRGPDGAGLTSHGGGGACGRPARSVRTSESARHRDQRDLRSDRSRAGTVVGARSLRRPPPHGLAGGSRRLRKVLSLGSPGTAVPSHRGLLSHLSRLSVRASARAAVGEVRAVGARLSVRAPGLAARGGSPGALLGRRERGSQLCAPCRLRRAGLGPQASPSPLIPPLRAAVVQKGSQAGRGHGRPGAGEEQKRGDGDRWRQAVPRSPLPSAVAVSHPQMFWGPVFKMKKFNFRKVLDGLTASSPGSGSSSGNSGGAGSGPAHPGGTAGLLREEIQESLTSDYFQICKTVRHGFPYQPTALAFDPVQKILAIGTRTGAIRILGRPGVDCYCQHESGAAVLQLQFLINEGALVSASSDDTLHLWNLRQKRPAILHSLKFNRERITYCHLPFQSKWLYVGTERGNTHIVNIESFILSGYVIMWNKAIELSTKTHPGPVVHLSDSPRDEGKLLIGYENGTVVFWDLKSKRADLRVYYDEAIHSIDWHHEGKQFMCSHSDGSLTLWNLKSPSRPFQTTVPHGKSQREGRKSESCKPILKVEYKTCRNSEPFIIFSGGLSYDKACRRPSLTIMHGKAITVLEMDHPIVEFLTLCETPYPNEFQEPYAVAVLLEKDLIVVDLTQTNFPIFENPYPMDIHESPVTCTAYFADCPPDLILVLYSIGVKHKKQGYSNK
ncbi:syntaxin-binding protein 5-like isoform X1, partial [Sigmodon hispidus]